MKTAIYFIAIIPDPKICEEVTRFKQYALEHFDSGRALRSPPHITLEPPFKWTVEKIREIELGLEEFVLQQVPFSIDLHNFDAFAPRVVFVDVQKNQLLEKLQGNLKEFLREKLELKSDRPDRPFHAHMTIAFKDLRKAMFKKAWDYFSRQEYQRRFLVNAVHLLKHNGKVWEVQQSFFFPS